MTNKRDRHGNVAQLHTDTEEDVDAELRRMLVFGGRPMASSLRQLKKCAEYWAMKDLVQIARLRPARDDLIFVFIGFEGIARLKRIFLDFNSLREGWESYQAKIFHMFCNTLIKDILGTDRERCLEMVMGQNHWDEIPDEVLLLASRGSGKTWLLMSALAVFFAHIPGFTACIYAGTSAKGQDFYSGIVDQIKCIFQRMDPAKRPKLNITKDMTTAVFGEDDMRWIRPFSTFGMVRAKKMWFSFFFFLFLFFWWDSHASDGRQIKKNHFFSAYNFFCDLI